MKHLIAVFIVICATAAFGQKPVDIDSDAVQLRILAFDLGRQLGYSDAEITASCKSGTASAVADYAHQMSNATKVLVDLLKQNQQTIAVLKEANKSLSNGLEELRSATLLMPLYQPLPEPQQVNIHVTQQPAPIAPSFPDPQVKFPVFCQSQTYGSTTYSNCF